MYLTKLNIIIIDQPVMSIHTNNNSMKNWKNDILDPLEQCL